jgi:hypothetical protein
MAVSCHPGPPGPKKNEAGRAAECALLFPPARGASGSAQLAAESGLGSALGAVAWADSAVALPIRMP